MASDTAPSAGATAGHEDYESIGRSVAAIAFTHPGWKLWWLAFGAAVALLLMLLATLVILFWKGVGLWGNNIPVTWALDIVSYDWWIGVACGGLFVSGLSLLLGLEWRNSVNRIAEAMALIAGCTAAIYPIIHLGRPWFFYWNLPYPNSMVLWPQFRSPLYWDAIDIISFLGISLSFWYLGMLPDLASLRDRAFAAAQASGRGLLRARIYGVLALGWRGSAVHWRRWSQAYRTIALFGVLVVVSLQTGAAVMFAGSLEPGWHDTLQPFAFIVGAIFAGVGVLAMLVVLIRAVFALKSLITERHLDVIAKLLLGLGWINIYCYAEESFNTELFGDAYDLGALTRRLFGPHGWSFWLLVASALISVQVFWSGRVRRSALALFTVGLLVAMGMWADRFVVIVITLQRDFLPSSDHPYGIEIWGAVTYIGSAGLFLALMLLFLRYLPVVSIVEARRLVPIGDRSPPLGEPEPVPDAPIWAVSAEFASPDAAVDALKALGETHPGRLDIYSPVPVPEAGKAIGLPRQPIRVFALAGVLLGGVGMMFMCVYATAYDYVFDVGGRPQFSWPSFVVPSFSWAMLCGALAVILSLLLLNRLPRLNHPAFNIPHFGSSTDDRFFLVVEARGNDFDPAAVETTLAGLRQRPLAVSRVPR